MAESLKALILEVRDRLLANWHVGNRIVAVHDPEEVARAFVPTRACHCYLVVRNVKDGLRMTVTGQACVPTACQKVLINPRV